MKLKDFSETLNEASIEQKISKKASKLITALDKKKLDLTLKLHNKIPAEKLQEIKSTLKTIEKAKPIIVRFKKYFQNLEEKFDKLNLDEQEKKEKIRKRYDEIRNLFISDLFNIMRTVGYDEATIIASSIATIIFFIVFVPGGLLVALPTILMLKKLKENKAKVNNKKFLKDLEKIENKLKKAIAKR